jgi:hypothetical protein
VRRVVALLVALSLVGSAAEAMAAEITRDEYRERVEPICKVNTEANERILAGARQEVKGGRLDIAAKQFARAAKALKQTRAQLLAVPMPATDQAKLTKWLTAVKAEAALLETAGKALAKGDKPTAERAVARLSTNASRANSEVVSFEFHYCSFQPAKYT